MNTIRLNIVITILSLILASCVSQPRKTDGDRVSLMSYNVENLFDTEKAPDKNDHTYLPLSLKTGREHRRACKQLERSWWQEECLTMDWSEQVLEEKLRRVASVIQQAGSSGPDLLILVEVENKNVLEQLVKKHLPNSGYKTIVLEPGPDLRGINIGMISRLPVVEGSVRLHTIPFQPVKTPQGEETVDASRGILEATFELPDGEWLTAFGVHFPSQGAMTEFREQAIAKLNQLYQSLPKGRLAIAGGDFNISSEEEPDLYGEDLKKVWGISHHLGCKGCRGTYYYGRGETWNFLDALLFSPDLTEAKGAWRVDPASIHTPKANRYQLNSYLSPARFNPKKPIGVSDHLPIYGELVRVKR